MTDPRRYSPIEVREILGRALEIEDRRDVGLSLDEVVAAAVEVGVSSDAVLRATQEATARWDAKQTVRRSVRPVLLLAAGGAALAIAGEIAAAQLLGPLPPRATLIPSMIALIATGALASERRRATPLAAATDFEVANTALWGGFFGTLVIIVNTIGLAPYAGIERVFTWEPVFTTWALTGGVGGLVAAIRARAGASTAAVDSDGYSRTAAFKKHLATRLKRWIDNVLSRITVAGWRRETVTSRP